MPQDQRLKQRPIDIPFKVWKGLVKSYEKLDAQRKVGNESIQVLNFSLNIIQNVLILISILDMYLCENKLNWFMFKDKASKARLTKTKVTHSSGQKGLKALITTFVSILNM